MLPSDLGIMLGKPTGRRQSPLQSHGFLFSSTGFLFPLSQREMALHLQTLNNIQVRTVSSSPFSLCKSALSQVILGTKTIQLDHWYVVGRKPKDLTA